MMVYNIFLFTGMFGVVFGTGEMLRKIFGAEVELTRKLVHFSTGAIATLFPFWLDSIVLVTIMCLGFCMLLIFAEHMTLLKCVTGVKRKSRGSFLFPISVLILFMLYTWTGSIIIYILPLVILSISDPLAAMAGKMYPFLEFSVNGNVKTISGSFAFFVSTFLIVYLASNLGFGGYELQFMLVFSLALTITEAVCKNGYDNLMIPIVASAILILSA